MSSETKQGRMAGLGIDRDGAELYEQMLGNLPDSIVVIDVDGTVVYTNGEAQDLLQREERPLIGRHFGFPAVTGEAADVEIISKKGVRIGEMRTSEIEHGGESLRLVCLRDVTEQRNAQNNYKGMLLQTIRTLSYTLEVRDPYTAGHELRVAEFAVALARRLGYDEDFIEGLRIGAMVHDIGKIAVPTQILTKPGWIEPEEMALVRIHPRIGFQILEGIAFPWPIAKMTYQHHERLDGSGYPQGLKGADIVDEAKILAVADTVEAMMNDRPYRKGRGQVATLDLIRAESGVTLDSDVCRVCVELFEIDGFAFAPY